MCTFNFLYFSENFSSCIALLSLYAAPAYSLSLFLEFFYFFFCIVISNGLILEQKEMILCVHF